jgi:hypothetical protein
MAMIAGNVAELFGYSNLFLVEIFFAVTALLCVQFLFEPRKEDEVILVKENQ